MCDHCTWYDFQEVHTLASFQRAVDRVSATKGGNGKMATKKKATMKKTATKKAAKTSKSK